MNASLSDLDLVQKFIKEGDHGSFSFLILRNKDFIERICLGIVHNSFDADDLAQEIAISLLDKLTKFKGQSTFQTWLYRFIYHKGIDFLRKRKRQSAHMALVAESFGLTNLRKPSIHEILGNLNAKESFLLHLKFYEDKTFREISEILKISEPSAKMRMKRVLDKIKLTCKNRGIEYEDLV